MRVILAEADILMAIEDFVLATVKVPDNIRIDIDLKATRGADGYTAEIDLVHMNLPIGASDNAAADVVEATEEARAEGLGIVEKIDAARADAKAPRRRGRPPGSKNLPKTNEALVEAAQETEKLNQPIESVTAPQPDVIEEAAPSNEAEAEPVEDLAPEAVEVNDAAPEPVEEETSIVDEPDPEPNSEEALAAEAEATEPQAETPVRSLFGNLSETKTDDGPTDAQPAEVEATDTDPVEEEEDYAPTPETPGFTTEDAEGKDETPAPAPTRSLFADLTKPTN